MSWSNSLSTVIYRLVPAVQLLSSTVLVLVTVVAAGSPPAGEDYRQGWRVVRRSRMREPNTPSEAEKIAGSDFSRAKRARRARIRDDTRKSRINMRPAELHTTGGFAAEITRLSPRLCHATRDDISIAGSPPAGEDDGVGVFISYGAGTMTAKIQTAVILAAPVSSFPP